MVKDEDVCLHCGPVRRALPDRRLDMQKFLLEMTNCRPGCRSHRQKNSA